MKIPKSVYISGAGLIFSAFYLNQSAFTLPETKVIRTPATQAFDQGIAGAGIIEAQEKNTRVAPFFAGRVVRR
jgi:hypothetical protein